MGRVMVGASADCLCAGCYFLQPHLLYHVYQEVCYPLTGGGWHSELGAEDFRDDCVERLAEVHKQDPRQCLCGVERLQDVMPY